MYDNHVFPLAASITIALVTLWAAGGLALALVGAGLMDLGLTVLARRLSHRDQPVRLNGSRR